MKLLKILSISTTMAVALALSGCENFTEVDTPDTQLGSTQAFSDNATAVAALSDIYARMRESGMVTGRSTGLSSLMGNYTDEMTFYGENTDIMAFNNHTVLPSNSLVSGLWNQTYGQIYAANALLEGVENSTGITGQDSDRLIGEALFIRSFLHFYLTELFGDVPYITTTDYTANALVSRMPQDQVRELVLADLALARDLLPDSYPTEERVRANKAVANALIARVSLYSQDWDGAAIAADAVINDPAYIWEENVENVFLKDSQAIIWALHPGVDGLNTLDAKNFFIPYGPPFKPSLSEDFMSAFEPGDLRKEYWTSSITEGADSWSYAYKYKKTLATMPSQEYTILFRLDEMYLIRAEARAHLGDITGAQQDINKIRSRAGLPPTSAVTLQQLVNAVIQERRIELFCEQGHRWFDLKRTGMADTVLSQVKPNWQNTQILLPVPEAELLLNSHLLPQNPGY